MNIFPPRLPAGSLRSFPVKHRLSPAVFGPFSALWPVPGLCFRHHRFMQLSLGLEAPSLPPGLFLLEDWLSESEESELVAAIDAASWSAVLSRRVQHYGWRYDYRSRSVSPSDFLGPLPDWLGFMLQRLSSPVQPAGTSSSSSSSSSSEPAAPSPVMGFPDQVIVNEYLPGQGIAAHVDAPLFGPVVASCSLLSPVEFMFAPPASSSSSSSRSSLTPLTLMVPPRSLLVMTGPARTSWSHAIPARKRDSFGSRSRRVSVTFRTVRSKPRTSGSPRL